LLMLCAVVSIMAWLATSADVPIEKMPEPMVYSHQAVR